MPLIIYNCEPIFHVIHILNTCVYQKTVPAFFESTLSLYLIAAPFPKNSQSPVSYRRPLPIPYNASPL